MSQKHKNTVARLRQQIDAMEREHMRQCAEFVASLANAAEETRRSERELKSLRRRCVATVDAESWIEQPDIIRCVLNLDRYKLDHRRLSVYDLSASIAQRLAEQLCDFQGSKRG